MKNLIGRMGRRTLCIIWMLSFISISSNSQEAEIISSYRVDGLSCTHIKICGDFCRIHHERILIKYNISILSSFLPDEFYPDNNSTVFNTARLQRTRKKFLKCSKSSAHEYKFYLYNFEGSNIPVNRTTYKMEISNLLGTRAPPFTLPNNIFYIKLIDMSDRNIHPFFAYLVYQSVQISFDKDI